MIYKLNDIVNFKDFYNGLILKCRIVLRYYMAPPYIDRMVCYGVEIFPNDVSKACGHYHLFPDMLKRYKVIDHIIDCWCLPNCRIIGAEDIVSVSSTDAPVENNNDFIYL